MYPLRQIPLCLAVTKLRNDRSSLHECYEDLRGSPQIAGANQLLQIKSQILLVPAENLIRSLSAQKDGDDELSCPSHQQIMCDRRKASDGLIVNPGCLAD